MEKKHIMAQRIQREEKWSTEYFSLVAEIFRTSALLPTLE